MEFNATKNSMTIENVIIANNSHLRFFCYALHIIPQVVTILCPAPVNYSGVVPVGGDGRKSFRGSSAKGLESSSDDISVNRKH